MGRLPKKEEETSKKGLHKIRKKTVPFHNFGIIIGFSSLCQEKTTL
jgi:hypothetical protein